MGPMYRPAGLDDLLGLTALEEAANLVALAHVFPPERYPFPTDDVLARWVMVLAEPGVTTMVRDADALVGGSSLDGGSGRLAAFAAYDASSLRHLAVDPAYWGRGLAAEGVDLAVSAIRDGGAPQATLWCLEENHRARGLYEHLGWRAGEGSRPAPWPPHPTERQYVLGLTSPSPEASDG